MRLQVGAPAADRAGRRFAALRFHRTGSTITSMSP